MEPKTRISVPDPNFMWKDPTSNLGSCAALYGTRVLGGYVVQGKALDDETRALLRDLADDEDAVFVPAAVLDRLREL
ncbi:MAG: lipid A biosynthesis lauroyl acyltransferase [Acidimicrobiales bacterium]